MALYEFPIWEFALGGSMGLVAGQQIGCKFQSRSARRVSEWCESGWKRRFDMASAILLLVLLFPFMLIIALAVKCTSRGPVLFRQRRMGRNRDEFSIFKFRTMICVRRHHGPLLTNSTDPRVTRLGRFLRRWKLDEFPQLFNVLRGDMSFVGPRPHATELWIGPEVQEAGDVVLSVRPGITSQATLNFRHEEEMLTPLQSHNVEEFYTKSIMPLKLNMEIDYLRDASFGSDLRIIFQTVSRIFTKAENTEPSVEVQNLEIEKASRAMQIEREHEYASSADRAD
jgi:lipopolysaccharide/colanic/teichoic acid biosynthesis glycosyltransferase